MSVEGDATSLPGDGLPVGIAETDYDQHQLVLAPGERLVLYSDGVTESMNADAVMFGNARLIHSLRKSSCQPLDAVASTLLADVHPWCGNAPPHDDVSILVLEYEPAPHKISNPNLPGCSLLDAELPKGMPHSANLAADRISPPTRS